MLFVLRYSAAHSAGPLSPIWSSASLTAIPRQPHRARPPAPSELITSGRKRGLRGAEPNARAPRLGRSEACGSRGDGCAQLSEAGSDGFFRGGIADHNREPGEPRTVLIAGTGVTAAGAAAPPWAMMNGKLLSVFVPLCISQTAAKYHHLLDGRRFRVLPVVNDGSPRASLALLANTSGRDVRTKMILYVIGS